MPCVKSYTSHELRIGFQCKGSCKGPYTLTAVSDYNAWYNETLNSFFFINATMIKTKWRMEPLCRGNPGFFKALACCHGNSIFFCFLHNNVFMTLVPAGGLLANMGGQDSLRQRQNTHSAIYCKSKKHVFWR